MYLRASQYVSGYEFQPDDRRALYQSLVEQMGVAAFVDPGTPSGSVEFVVAYWRKANQIHQWFVENVQGGEDECKPHYVNREQLGDLRQLCLRVLAVAETETGKESVSVLGLEGRITEEEQETRRITNPAAVEEELPTAAGFFFGSTEYDEWYLRDIEDTVKMLDRALSMPDEWEFEYQSSW